MNKKNHRSFGYIRKLPSKLYQASYVGPNGKRFYAPRPFIAKADADGFLAREQTAINNGKWVEPRLRVSATAEPVTNVVTLREIFPKYLQTRTTRSGDALRRQTKDLYTRQMYSTMNRWLDVPLCEITKAGFTEWYMELQSRGKKTTASKCYSLMRAVLSWAVEEQLLDKNPVQIKGGYTSSTGRETEILTEGQIRALADAIEPHLQLGVLLAAYAGLRFSEISGLQRKDVQILPSAHGIPEELVIHVRRGATRVSAAGTAESSKKFEVHLGPPKSRMSKRTVSVHSGLIPHAKAHLEKYVGAAQTSPVFGVGPNRTDLMTYDYFEHRYSTAKRAIGCGGIAAPIHSLRKFGATQYANSGANLNELSEWLGDSSIEAIKRYVKSSGRARTLANKMRFKK
jgi:integrase